MPSSYFYKKINSNGFDNNIAEILETLKDKKVLIYGAGEGFLELNKKYYAGLNIVAIADMKFKEEGVFENLRAINPEDITKIDYDYILVTNETYFPVLNYLTDTLKIENDKIKVVFKYEVQDERSNVIYLEDINFGKRLNKLEKNLKNKKIVVYGGGMFFQAMAKFYDLSKLNIVAISDKKFSNHTPDELFFGYKACTPEEIVEIKPDYVLVATKYFINVIEGLEEKTLAKTKIKVRPLIKKPFKELWTEIWG